MKKAILLLAILIVFVPPCFSIEWHIANKFHVGWNLSTYEVEENERISYIVMIKDRKENVIELGSIREIQHHITLSDKGSYFVGIQTTLEIYEDQTGWVRVAEAPISWTDDPDVCEDGKTFGVRYYPVPERATGLKTISE